MYNYRTIMIYIEAFFLYAFLVVFVYHNVFAIKTTSLQKNTKELMVTTIYGGLNFETAAKTQYI